MNAVIQDAGIPTWGVDSLHFGLRGIDNVGRVDIPFTTLPGSFSVVGRFKLAAEYVSTTYGREIASKRGGSYDEDDE